MPTFMCFLNWTDQGAKNAKDSSKRFQASQSMAGKLGGKLLSAYVTTGHYDVVLTLDMPNGETNSLRRIWHVNHQRGWGSARKRCRLVKIETS